MSNNITDCIAKENCESELSDLAQDAKENENTHHFYLAIVPPVTIACLLMIILGIFFFCKSKRYRQATLKSKSVEDCESDEIDERPCHLDYEHTESSNVIIDSATEISSIMSGDLSSLDQNALYMHTVDHYGSSSSDDDDIYVSMQVNMYPCSHTP